MSGHLAVFAFSWRARTAPKGHWGFHTRGSVWWILSTNATVFPLCNLSEAVLLPVRWSRTQSTPFATGATLRLWTANLRIFLWRQTLHPGAVMPGLGRRFSTSLLARRINYTESWDVLSEIKEWERGPGLCQPFPPLKHLSDFWGRVAGRGWGRIRGKRCQRRLLYTPLWTGPDGETLEELFPSQCTAEGTQDGSLPWRRESTALQIGRKKHRMSIWGRSLHFPDGRGLSTEWE